MEGLEPNDVTYRAHIRWHVKLLKVNGASCEDGVTD